MCKWREQIINTSYSHLSYMLLFFNDLLLWCVPCLYLMIHYAWNLSKRSLKDFFKTLFCIILNSSDPSHEVVKDQPMFQRCREKVVFCTAFSDFLACTAKKYGISCPQSDLKKLLEGAVVSFHAPSAFGGWCPCSEYGGVGVRWFIASTMKGSRSNPFPDQVLFMEPESLFWSSNG